MVDPVVGYSRLLGARRVAVVERCRELEHQLAGLDQALSDLFDQRNRVAEDLRSQRERLLTTLDRRGRKPAPAGFAALPPVPADAQFVRGRRLRAVCLALLARFGEQSLVQLHGLLHRHGFAVDHDHSVKALADALGYDTDKGRVRRVCRGVYAAIGTPPPRVMALLVSPC